MLTLAFKKLNLQRLQINSLKNSKNQERLNEQRKVLLKMLLNPRYLVSEEFIPQEKQLDKYLNVITSKVLSEKKYRRTLELLKQT